MAYRYGKGSLERQNAVMSTSESHESNSEVVLEYICWREEVRNMIKEELQPFIGKIQDIHTLLLAKNTSGNANNTSLCEDKQNHSTQIEIAEPVCQNVQQETYSIDSNDNSFKEKTIPNKITQVTESILDVENATEFNTDEVLAAESEIQQSKESSIQTSSSSQATKINTNQSQLPRSRSLPKMTLNSKPPMKRQQTTANLHMPAAHKKLPVDERVCLENALQSNVGDIVENLIFDESELPDQLIGDGCLTENECFIIRKRNRQDQVRLLISLIKGRDLLVLRKFLKIMERSNKVLTDKIIQTYEENKTCYSLKGAKCPCCEMKTKVDIKYVADAIWSRRAISDGLYNEIVYSENYTGSQDGLWIRMLESMNNIIKKEDRLEVYTELVCVLDKKKYSYIAKRIEQSLQKEQCLSCKCFNFHMYKLSRATPTVSSFSPQSSVSKDEFSSSHSESDHLVS